MTALLDDEDALTPELTAALTEIFKKFDKDGDECLSPEEIKEFGRETNDGETFTQETLDEMAEYFDMLDGKLTKKGFFEMYQLQTLSEPEETIKDLKKYGYTDFTA